MQVVRNAVRKPLQLRACLEITSDTGSGRRIPARTLDLSTHGVGLIAHHPLPAGQIVTIMIEDGDVASDEALGRNRQRRWRGHVAYSTSGKVGRRLGICFEEPEFGPQITFETRGTARGTRRVRLDGPTIVEMPEPAVSETESPASGRTTTGLRPLQSAALIGLGLDQIAKALLASAAPAAAGRPQTIVDDWSSLVITLAGLGSAGVLARLVERTSIGERPGVSGGIGLILGALLSGLVDQLVFGEVRTIGTWSVTPAHLLAATGAAVAMGSLILPKGALPECANDTYRARRPANPGCAGLGCD